MIDGAEVELIRSSPLFDSRWYLETYPDVSVLDMDPAIHYLTFGARLGRNPSANFNGEKYAQLAALDPSVNPLLHFLSAESDKALPRRVPCVGSMYDDGAAIRFTREFDGDEPKGRTFLFVQEGVELAWGFKAFELSYRLEQKRNFAFRWISYRAEPGVVFCLKRFFYSREIERIFNSNQSVIVALDPVTELSLALRSIAPNSQLVSAWSGRAGLLPSENLISHSDLAVVPTGVPVPCLGNILECNDVINALPPLLYHWLDACSHNNEGFIRVFGRGPLALPAVTDQVEMVLISNQIPTKHRQLASAGDVLRDQLSHVCEVYLRVSAFHRYGGLWTPSGPRFPLVDTIAHMLRCGARAIFRVLGDPAS